MSLWTFQSLGFSQPGEEPELYLASGSLFTLCIGTGTIHISILAHPAKAFAGHNERGPSDMGGRSLPLFGAKGLEWEVHADVL